MEEIELFTRDGGYVATVLVPIFNVPADSITWGARTFILKDGSYVEGMNYHAVRSLESRNTDTK